MNVSNNAILFSGYELKIPENSCASVHFRLGNASLNQEALVVLHSCMKAHRSTFQHCYSVKEIFKPAEKHSLT